MNRFKSFLTRIQHSMKDYCKYQRICQYFDPTNYTCNNNENAYCGKYRSYEAEKALGETVKPEQT